jgi:hypothetical protein
LGTPLPIQSDNEIIRRRTAPEGLEFLVDGISRLELQAALVRLLNGANVIQTTSADGAGAQAFTQEWLSGVDTPTTGAQQDRVVQIAANGTTKNLLRDVRWVGYPLSEWRDGGGTVRADLGHHPTQPALGGYPSGDDFVIGSNGGFAGMRLLATQIKLQTAVGTAAGFVMPFTNGSGITLTAGDLCRISTAANQTVIRTTGAAQSAALVVVTGNTNGAIVQCALTGVFPILCTTTAVVAQGIIQTSATQEQGATAASALAANVGYALQAKSGGATGLVMALIGPPL